MPSRRLPLLRRTFLTATSASLAAVLAVSMLGQPSTPSSAPAEAAIAPAGAEAGPNPVTPGAFSGYAFDQCLAPTQKAMNAWLQHSPYLGVGIYISGDSRACRSQPNLTPTWIRTQLANGWRLLPITLGPQASCQPRFPRYRDDFKISPKRGADGKYQTARRMGRNSAAETVADAKRLGIVKRSTLWYDLEGFDITNRDCRESALAFLSAWTYQIRALGYKSGVYSSAGSGIAALDKARINRRRDITQPDRIWLARWDGKANTSSSYVRADGWRPGNRVKQYRGGHDEVWGKVRINIDSNRADLGPRPKTPVHCASVQVSLRTYKWITPRTARESGGPAQVKALQCLLKERKVYTGNVNGKYTTATIAAVKRWQKIAGDPQSSTWTRTNWMSLLAWGRRPWLKFGTMGWDVYRLQRSLNAAAVGQSVAVNGVYNQETRVLVNMYRRRADLPANGIVSPTVWTRLRKGIR